MAIKLDRSTASGILVKCDECSYWHAFAWTNADAWAAGRRHEAAAHNTVSDRTRNASDQASARRRHAGDN